MYRDDGFKSEIRQLRKDLSGGKTSNVSNVTRVSELRNVNLSS